MKNGKEIKYFSMFTGVGGFELGLARSFGNVESESEEETTRNSNRNKSISQGQKESNNTRNNKEIKNTKNTNRTLLQNRQESSNSKSRNMEEIKGYTELRQSLRQTSDGILRKGDGIRDDKKNLQFREDKPNISKFECVGFSEIDKYASELLKQKFPTVKNWGDCTKINPNELPDFDMLCGGFPCQAFSIAGKRKGFNDTRGTLFFEITRILKIKRPKLILLENVKGLLNHEKGKTFSVIIQTLEELGYRIQWMVLNSKFFGVPQNRERVFIIGSLRGESRPEVLPFRESNREINTNNKFKISNSSEREFKWQDRAPCLASRDYKEPKLVQMNNPTHSNNRIYREEGLSPSLNTAQGGNRQPKIRAVLTPDRPEKRQNGRRFKEPGEPSFTMTGQDIHGVSDGMKIRRLIPIECERLQGFPDNWTEGFSDTQRYKMMGNAVTVNVIKAIGEKLIR